MVYVFIWIDYFKTDLNDLNILNILKRLIML